MPAFAGPLVLLHVASSTVEGQLLEGLLRSEGLPVFTKGEGEGPYRLGPMYVFVPADFEVQARLVLAEVLTGRTALTSEDDDDVWPEAEREADPKGAEGR